MANITDVEHVKDVTGTPVSSDDIRRAQTLIEIQCGRVLDDGSTLSARDRHFCQLAVAYQAAFMQAKPDVFTQMDVASISQVGLAVAFREERSSIFLAPLAAASLRRCRWQGSRSIRMNSVFQGRVDVEADQNWSPL